MTIFNTPFDSVIAFITRCETGPKGGGNMIGKKKKAEIDEVIEKAIHNLNEDILIEGYGDDVETLERLVRIKSQLKGQRPKMDPNNVLKTIAYFGGLITILEYEQLRVISSKAFSRLIRIL